MGTLMYGAGIEVAIDDRTLAHLQIVITGKLRRGECFFFNWHDSAAVGGGRSAIWLSRATPVQFHIQEQDKLSINREWLDQLMTSANSSAGLQYIPEPGQEARPPGAHLHHRPIGAETPAGHQAAPGKTAGSGKAEMAGRTTASGKAAVPGKAPAPGKVPTSLP